MIKIPEINLHLGDCMDLMRGKPNGFYSLGIVDPPYGIGASSMNMGSGKSKRCSKIKNRKWSAKEWDNATPEDEYFSELFRVSKSQIIWGGNYFNLGPCKNYVIWDKEIAEALSFASCEMAWTSFDMAPKMFRHSAYLDKSGKIHPTQKPVALYKWILTNYAKPGDRILDTHGGSGSSMIACYDLGFDMDWIELDPDYFKSAKERFERHKAQGQLFHIAETLPEQQKLF